MIMKSTQVDPPIQKKLESIIHQYPLIPRIVEHINAQSGHALLVGGAVRDLLLGMPLKDLDIEVHGITLADLEALLREYGAVSLVGKSFGVLRLHGLDVDWSLPRADTAGRKPRVIIDPFMDINDAFARRDLTINAMGIDLMTYALIDPFHGKDDLQKKILRAPDVRFFSEDPLRLFRVMQFIGRFDMYPDDILNDLCKTMDISAVSRERIEQEFEKLLLKSKKPSKGIRWLCSINRLHELFPELAALIGVPQEPEWHPEGDVFEHTMQSLDAMAQIISNYELQPYDSLSWCNEPQIKLAMLYAALCHDLGKAVATVMDKDKQRVTSIGHELASEKIARTFLRRITHNKEVIDIVCILARYHMAPLQFIQGNAKLSAYKRLARKLAPHATLHMLADLARADRQGRNPQSHEPLTGNIKDIDQFLEKAQKALVLYKPELPLLYGDDVRDIVDPGPQMGKLLKYAYEVQIEEGIKDKQELKELVARDFMHTKK